VGVAHILRGIWLLLLILLYCTYLSSFFLSIWEKKSRGWDQSYEGDEKYLKSSYLSKKKLHCRRFLRCELTARLTISVLLNPSIIVTHIKNHHKNELPHTSCPYTRNALRPSKIRLYKRRRTHRHESTKGRTNTSPRQIRKWLVGWPQHKWPACLVPKQLLRTM
jgi:hypothetical protein